MDGRPPLPFSTTCAATTHCCLPRTAQEAAQTICRKYGITHLFVEPGEPLGFDVSQAHWLHPLPNPGSLQILATDFAPAPTILSTASEAATTR